MQSSLVLWLFACGGAATQFEPVRASDRASATYPVTSYELKIGGSVVGDAVVWSEGADDDSRNGQVLDIEIAIRNATLTPLDVDVTGSAVSVTRHDGRTALLSSPRLVGGSRTVAPNSALRLGLHYPLPAGLPAYDVKSFEFNWRVASGGGEYAQSTAFVSLPLPNPDDFNERGFPCSPQSGYRVANLEECLGPPVLVPR